MNQEIYDKVRPFLAGPEIIQFLSEASEIRRNQIQMVLDKNTAPSKVLAMQNLKASNTMTKLFIEAIEKSPVDLEELSTGALDNAMLFGSEMGWSAATILAVADEEEFSYDRARELWDRHHHSTAEDMVEDTSPLAVLLWLVTMASSNVEYISHSWAINRLASNGVDDAGMAKLLPLLQNLQR